jgi:hypothetical protein
MECQRRSCEHECLSDGPTSTTCVARSLAEDLHTTLQLTVRRFRNERVRSLQQWPKQALSRHETSSIRENDALGAPSPV